MSSALKIPLRSERSVAGGRRSHPRQRKVTLGDLIAAVVDATGGDAQKARALLSSRELSYALRRRIVLT
jgi:hypothetical protein